MFVPYPSFFSLIFSCWFFVYRLAIAGEGFVFPLNLVLLLHRAYSREDCSSLWDLRFVDDEEIHVFVLSVPFSLMLSIVFASTLSLDFVNSVKKPQFRCSRYYTFIFWSHFLVCLFPFLDLRFKVVVAELLRTVDSFSI